MLSCRYEIRSIDLTDFSALRAIDYSEESKKPLIRIAEENRVLLQTITKSNSLLFEAMELLRADDLEQKARSLEAEGKTQEAAELTAKANRLKKEGGAVSHDVSDIFLDDVCIMNWAVTNEKLIFTSQDGKISFSAETMRKTLLADGFYIGSTKMLPGLAGAGMARDGKFMFISERYRDRALSKATLGIMHYSNGQLKLGIRDDHSINAAKLNSYVGLAESDGTSLRELVQIARKKHLKTAEGEFNPLKIEDLFSFDHMIVVRDCEPNDLVNPLCDLQITNPKGESTVHVKAADQKYNLSDGYGFISPRAMKAINRLRRIRKPGEFMHKAIIIRLPFVKGLLLEMDFSSYLKEEKQVKEIEDMFGRKVDPSEVDIILTQSMFKGLTYFSNLPPMRNNAANSIPQENKDNGYGWQEYCDRLKGSDLSMVIAGTDSRPAKQTHLNLQLLSTVLPDADTLNSLFKKDVKTQQTIREILDNWSMAKEARTPQNDSKKAADAQQKADSAKKKLEDARTKFEEALKKAQEAEETQKKVEQTRKKAEAAQKKFEEAQAKDEEAQKKLKELQAKADENQKKAEETQKNLKAQADAICTYFRSLDQKDTDGESVENSKAQEASSYTSILADMIEQNPVLAGASIVRSELCNTLLTRAIDFSSGRLTASGDVRLLVGDPFMLLDHIADGKNNAVHPINRYGLCYAPKIQAEELAILRNPHVSPFEDVVLYQVSAKREGADGSDHVLYEKYLSDHSGMIFIPAYVAAALGGADYDGDRAQVITCKEYVQLIRKKNESIAEMLLNAEQPPEGKKWLFIPKELTQQIEKSGRKLKMDMLPPVVINGASQKMILAGDYKGAPHLLQEKLHYTYLDSIDSKVGFYSNKAVSVALSPDVVDQNDPEKKKIAEEELKLTRLWTLAAYTVIVGLDIDSAKTGCKPTLPAGLLYSASPSILRFTQYLKNSSGTGSGDAFRNYADAMDACGIRQLSSITPINSLLNTFDISACKISECGGSMKAILFPAQPKNASAEDAPKSLVSQQTVDAALKLLRGSSAQKQLRRELNALKELMAQRRENIHKYLLKRYTLSQANRFLNLLLDGTADTLPELISDEEMLRYAFLDAAELRKAFGEKLFGSEPNADAGFVYDSTVLSLIKEVVRYRSSRSEQQEKSSELNAMAAELLPRQIGGAKAKLEKLVDSNEEAMFELGKLLLSAKQPISEMNYVLIFGEGYAAHLKKGVTQDAE